jgi:ribonuclease HI
MRIISKEDMFRIKITGDDGEAFIRFSPEEKRLVIEEGDDLTQFLVNNEDQLRKLLHNKRVNTFYVGFELAFSLIDGKDVHRFNNRDNIVVVDGTKGEIFVIDKVERHEIIEIFTDGSFNEKSSLGAYTVLIRDLEGNYSEYAYYSDSKSSSMIELEAAIKGLELVEGDVRIITDSQYVRKGITEWIVHWRLNGWTTANGTPAKNIESWKRFEILCAGRRIELQWVKGHSNHFENEYCDLKSREMTQKKD